MDYVIDDEVDEDDAFPIIYSDDEKDGDDYINEVENSKIMSTSNFTILSESDIKRLQEDDITHISTLLSISRVAACLLLYHFDWSVTKVHEGWFDAEEKVRKATGLLHEPRVCFLDSEFLTCEICFDTFSSKIIKSAGCNHPYCIYCWKEYINTKINEGPHKCLTLKCPNPSCDVAIDGDMIHQIASEPNKEKYDKFLIQSYVEKNKKMKWCPGPGCKFVVVFEPNGVSNKLDITCLCYHNFCWNCGEDAHSPLDCETVKRWVEKLDPEAPNRTWILTYTKPCPKCKIPIEKNEGCMEMKCKCGFQFCWLCLRDRSQCGNEGCNQISDREVNILLENNKEKTKRNEATEDVSRYTHYFERWAFNEFARKKALENMRAKNIQWLGVLFGKPEYDFEFINEAWQQVVECRRVLKWTYAYGYYIPENEKAKKEFFEYTQGEAEATLERFHHYMEENMYKFLIAKTEGWFTDFHLKLTDLTDATKNYFGRLVRALENGLADVQA